MSIQIKFGPSNSIEKPVSDYPTVSSILNDTNIKTLLGFGSNVEASVNGASGVEQLSDGDMVTISNRASTKG